jgi:membrane protein
LAFGFYLSHFNSYSNTYGALGGGIIFLTWLWLSAMALLFGAEINDVLAHMRSGEPLDDGTGGPASNGVA